MKWKYCPRAKAATKPEVIGKMQHWPTFLYRSCVALTPALLLSAGCATPSGEQQAKSPQVIAHRGASAYAPENTLSAFRLAHEMGAPYFELDTMLTRDGVMAVMHDNDLDRCSDGVGTLWESDLTYLKTLDAGSWFSPDFAGEKIPTLGEALDYAKGKIGVYIEIKSSDDDETLVKEILRLTDGHKKLTAELKTTLMGAIVESNTRNLQATRQAIALVREKKMEHEIVIQSFSPVVCYIALQEAPDLRTEFLGHDDKDKPKQWGQFVDFGMLIGVHGFNVHHESLNPERLAHFHNAGKSVAVWTVDDPNLMHKYAGWGVDFIITNKPDFCLQTLAK